LLKEASAAYDAKREEREREAEEYADLGDILRRLGEAG
jgi:hypothetical protein